MSLCIAGIGTAQPANALEQNRAADLAVDVCAGSAREERILRILYKNTRIENRQVVLTDADAETNGTTKFYSADHENLRGPGTADRMTRFENEAPPIAISACKKALANAQIAAQEITHLLTVSCSGFSAPGVDLEIFRALGLRASTRRLNVGFMGCHGAMNGLMAADAIVGQDPDAVVLLCAVELCSLHFQYGWNPGQVMANALFGDGAGAVVGTGRTNDKKFWSVARGGSHIFPDTADVMTWRVGDHGFEMFLSQEVPSLIEVNLRTWLEPWLGEDGTSLEEIRNWAIHPGGPRILKAVQTSLGLGDEDLAESWKVLRTCGNMSSPTTLFILEEIMARKRNAPCLMLGFGPGLAGEVLLLQPPQ